MRSLALSGSAHAPRLSATLRLELGATLEEALTRGIPLVFEVEARSDDWGGRLLARQQHEIRYLPLSNRYRLRDARGGERIFAQRAALIAALEQVELDLPRSPLQRYRLRFALKRDALPAPLRLPARFDPAWRLETEARWPPQPA